MGDAPCTTPIISHESWGGADLREVPCGECEACVAHCDLSKRADGLHSWGFDGDDPYVICHFCGERRDAISGRVAVSGVSHNPEEHGDRPAP